MAQLQILEHPDPRLRLKAEPVDAFDDDLAKLLDDLLETLYETTAIGLSAPQVGVLKEVLVLDLSEDRSAPEVYINPEILKRSTWGLVEESCLSVPGITGNVVRATEVRVRARDPEGAWFERDLSGMHAVCLQHEMDHLAGKLFIERLSIFRRLQLRAIAAVKGRGLGKAA